MVPSFLPFLFPTTPPQGQRLSRFWSALLCRKCPLSSLIDFFFQVRSPRSSSSGLLVFLFFLFHLFFSFQLQSLPSPSLLLLPFSWVPHQRDELRDVFQILMVTPATRHELPYGWAVRQEGQSDDRLSFLPSDSSPFFNFEKASLNPPFSSAPQLWIFSPLVFLLGMMNPLAKFFGDFSSIPSPPESMNPLRGEG